jgi:hypothetical protein
MLSVRVLVVDDYEPFRRFVCSTLEKRPELQIVCEVSDGLEAVQKSDLLAAVDAVLEGRQFVSSGLSDHEPKAPTEVTMKRS